MKVSSEQLEIVGSIPTMSVQEDYMNAEYISEQKPLGVPQLTYDLKKEANLDEARKIKETLKNAEEEKKAEENMKQWRLQLSAVETDAEKIKIAMEFEIDTLIEALQRNVERVDDIYLLFCKKEDRKPMHSDALKKIREDMESEYGEIAPYIKEAEDFKNKMM